MAKTFVGLIKGSGEGCDYTIGCNMRWEVAEAENEDDFVDSILEDAGMLNYESDGFGENLIESIEVWEVASQGRKYDKLDEFYTRMCKETKRNKEEREERALYEKLRAKFEK